MAVYSGPEIVKNGLVLHLDAATTKSFRGEPTVNLISDPLALLGDPSPLFLSGYESTKTRTSTLPLGLEMGKISPFWFKSEKTSSTNGRIFFLAVSGLSTGVDYCFSFYAYSADPTVTSIRCISDNSANSPVQSSLNYDLSRLGTIQRINCVFRSTAGGQTIGVRVGGSDPIGSTFYFTGIQVEQKSYPTPIVNGTRGTTVATGGGWADLSGNTNHGELVNGPTFNSNNLGSLVFDGVDDYVNNGTITTGGKITVNAWIKINTGGIFQHIVDSSSNSWHLAILNNNRPYFWNGSTYHQSAQILSTSTWYMITGVQSSTLDIYVNGVLSQSLSSNVNITTNNVNIGKYQSGTRPYNGNIAQVSIYNRALTPQEVRQNFYATRGRYGV